MISREGAVLVGVAWSGVSRRAVEDHLDELAQLVDTAGGFEVGRVVQERSSPDPAFFVGRGKVAEVKRLVDETEARVVVFDDDLSGAQVGHLERELPDGVKVLDRAGVILDIFAQRARTREAQTQVELAQLEYLLPRLTRRWSHLSRQAGGIGTRGVGETQLETDRRLIRRRIAHLRRRLAEVERERATQRRRRARLPGVALVGYTNAGKSTMFSALTGVETPIEDRLFATLDPLIRRGEFGDGLIATVSDTVGFIRKLPHHLVASFRSTLAEALHGDILVHVIDASHPGWAEQWQVGEEVLESLGVDPAVCVLALNKIDVLDEAPLAPLQRTAVAVSARTGAGLAELRRVVRQRILALPGLEVLRFPAEGGEELRAALAEEAVVAQRFTAEGIELVVRRGGERPA